MPLYEYECESCEHRFEVIQKFSDALVDTCPRCGAKVRKLISSPAIQFKGTGWYITDYAKKDSTAAGKAGGSNDDGGKERSGKEGTAKESSDKDGSAASAASSSKGGESAASAPAAAAPAAGASKKD